jgi:Ni/Co efflux regulator RcnB
MRRILLAALAATALVPVGAQAQSAREVRHDQREVARDQAEVQRDLARGKYHEAREDQQELREDSRETRQDWRDYRQSHREVYRRGTYAGPRGFVYRPVTVGYRFAPGYYASRYWIADPWTYRLTRPAVNQRWVRYGNDVLLVNVRNGRVLQVYRDFFW